MFSVMLYMLRQTIDNRAPPLLFPSFLPSYCDVSEARSYFASSIKVKCGVLFEVRTDFLNNI
jgi:hypothetical protein